MLRAPSCGGGQDKGRDHERRGERTNRVWVKHRVPPENREPHDRQRQPRIGAWTGGQTQPQDRRHTHQGEDPHDRRPARTPTGRPDQGKRPPGPDLYPVTVSYSAAYRAPGPAVAGFSVLRRSPRSPHSRPTSRPCPLPRRVSRFPPTQAGFVAWPPGIRGGLNGIHGGLSGVHGSATICRSNTPGSRASPIVGVASDLSLGCLGTCGHVR